MDDTLLNNPEKLLDALSSGGLDVEGLSPEDAGLIGHILAELRDSGDSSTLAKLYEIDYERKPPTIEEFCEDDYYFGNALRAIPEENVPGLFPKWREVLYRDFAPGFNIQQVIFTGGIGLGKLQRPNDLVLTPTGWRNIGSLSVGDFVIGADGFSTRVLGVYPHTDVELYRVSFKDGTYLEVGADHLWAVDESTTVGVPKTKKTQRILRRKVLDTKTLATLPLRSGGRNQAYNYRIPLVKPVHYADEQSALPIPPYTLGVLLGDGCLTKGSITIAGDDLEVGERVQKELPNLVLTRRAQDRCWVVSRGACGGVRDGNWLMAEIRRLGLAGLDCTNKYIPEIYLRSSPANRLALLQGLLDTDGSLYGRNHVGFFSCNQRLAQQVVEITRSLGGYATLTHYNRPGRRTEWRANLNLGAVCPFFLSRKIALWKPRTNQPPARSIVAVEAIGRGDGVCIKVEAVDQLYVAKDFIVTHNTKVGTLLLLYRAACALCLRNPLQFYGLMKSSSLIFSFFSVTQKQVKGGAFQDCVNLMAESPFFKERVAKLADRKFADRRVQLLKHVTLEAGSKLHEALGRNSLVTMIDEINFRLEKDGAKSAYDLVNGIKRRAVSRFCTEVGNPYLLIICSSTREETDFLTHYIQEQRNNPLVKIYSFPWWEVTGMVRMRYSGVTFRVDIGDNINPPRLLLENDLCPPEREIKVPEEHRKEFSEDLSGSIRDLAGRSVGRISKFFYDIRPLFNSIKDDVINPMSVEEVPISIESTTPIEAFVNLDKIAIRRGQQMIPLVNPFAPRFIHLDMSLGGDAFGFCMLHPTHAVEVGQFNPVLAVRETVTKPCFQVDLLFRLVRAPGSKEVLDFSKVRGFIWWLKTYVHFNIETVSADLLQLSVPALQPLQQAGVDIKYLSVDKTKTPYLGFRQAVMEGRFRTFDHEWLFLETQYLEDLPDKIDHPDKFPAVQIAGRMLDKQKGTKDCADSVAGAIASATASPSGLNLNTSKAAQHFFKEFAEQNQEAKNADSWIVQDVQPVDIRVV